MSTNAQANTVIVIPAFNEEASLQQLISGLTHIGTILIVDDASTDATAQIASRYAGIVLRNSINSGYEASLMRGLKYAAQNNFQYAISADADGQHTPQQIAMVASKLIEGHKLVITTRHAKPRWSEVIASCIGRYLWNVPDVFSGLKGYSIEHTKKFILQTGSGLIGAETFVRACCDGIYPHCTPIRILPRLDASRFGNSFRTNIKILVATAKLIMIYFSNKNTARSSNH